MGISRISENSSVNNDFSLQLFNDGRKQDKSFPHETSPDLGVAEVSCLRIMAKSNVVYYILLERSTSTWDSVHFCDKTTLCGIGHCDILQVMMLAVQSKWWFVNVCLVQKKGKKVSRYLWYLQSNVRNGYMGCSCWQDLSGSPIHAGGVIIQCVQLFSFGGGEREECLCSLHWVFIQHGAISLWESIRRPRASKGEQANSKNQPVFQHHEVHHCWEGTSIDVMIINESRPWYLQDWIRPPRHSKR